MHIGEILGLAAGAFSTFSMVPQIFKIYRYKKARDISVTFSSMFVAGGALWLAYGIIDGLLPVIVWNVLGLTFSSVMLIGKLMYMKNDKPEFLKIEEK